MRNDGLFHKTFRNRRRRRRHQRRGMQQSVLFVLIMAPVFFLILAMGASVFGLRMVSAFQDDLPSLDQQKSVELAQTSSILAADGTLLAYLHGVENRTVIGGDRIPEVIKNALVAVEDRRFYEHHGVDWEGVARALARNLEAGEIVQGASSITQQLVGNLYLDRTDTSFSRKFHEMSLALQLEEKMSKEGILEYYLNTVYFGSNAYGVQAAARTYFDKDPAELNLSESALLAGLPQAPSEYSPRNNPEIAKQRRDHVLLSMYGTGYITLEEYSSAVKQPVELAPYSPYTKVQEPYVVAYVRRQLIQMFGEDMVFKGGLTVETTVEPKYQQMAAESISSILDREDDPSAALVAIETRTGQIKDMVSGPDYDKSKFNLAAQGIRQPGSAFKTFVLTAAIEMGINPYTTYYESQPVELPLPNQTKPWKVRTFGHSYYGPSTITTATLRSDNTVFAQLAYDVTPARIVDVAQRMGITSTLKPYPAIALGGLTYGVSPLEMASAYGTLANSGRHRLPRVILRVRNAEGELIYEMDNRETQAISEGVAYEVTRILERNVIAGTGTRSRLDRPSAGKTGTTQKYWDAWFCGYVPQVSTAVWVGHPEAQIAMYDVHGRRVTGGSFPAMIWQDFMQKMTADYPVENFQAPSVQVSYIKDYRGRYGAVTTTSTSSTTTTSELPSTTHPPQRTTTTGPPSTQPTTTMNTTTTLNPPSTGPPSTQPTTTMNTTTTLNPPSTGPPSTQPTTTMNTTSQHRATLYSPAQHSPAPVLGLVTIAVTGTRDDGPEGLLALVGPGR